MPTDIFDEVSASPTVQAPASDLFDEVASSFDREKAYFNANPLQVNRPPVATPIRTGALESSLGDQFKAVGNVVRALPADIASMVSGAKGGNLKAAFQGEPTLPIDLQLKLASQEAPAAATLGKVGQGVAATAPMALAGGLPAWAGKLVAAGFSAKMIADAPELARQLGTELGKNPEDRDQDKLTSLVSDAIQTGVFAPLAGAATAHPTGNAVEIARALKKAVLTTDVGEAKRTALKSKVSGLEQEVSKLQQQKAAADLQAAMRGNQLKPSEPSTAPSSSRPPMPGAEPVPTAPAASQEPLGRVLEAKPAQDTTQAVKTPPEPVQSGLKATPTPLPILPKSEIQAKTDAELVKGYADYQAEAKQAMNQRRLQDASNLITQAQWHREEMQNRQNKPPTITREAESKTIPSVSAEVSAGQSKEPAIVKVKVNEPESQVAGAKVKVGKNPTPHTIVEVLPQSEAEKANGEHPIKVKNDRTGEESTVLQSDVAPIKQQPKKTNVPRGTIQSKLKALGYSDTEIAAMPADGQKALAERGQAKPRLGKGGPGAAEAGEPGTYSPIQQMADRLRTTAESNKPIDTQLHTMDKAKAVLSDVKDSVKRHMATLKAVGDAIWNKYKSSGPEYGDEKRAVGKWTYALQRADNEARNFAKALVADVPSKLRREAITNWIQADGDKTVLQDRANASSGTLKQGYEAAQNLTPREIEIAQMLREYYDQQLQNGIEAGILKDGLENYITQVWKKENPITKKLVSDLAFSKLQPNFKYARKRIFDSYFEGEQAGYVPQKDAGFLVANYDQSFNKSLAARAFIRDLHEGKASDGRPLVELSGNGKMIGEDEGKPTVLVNPHAKPEDISDYRTIDHPALRGWKWATKTPEGKNVFVKGDMLVHPEAYQKLKNRLSVSAFRQNPASRALLNVQSGIKQTMLSVSGFHQVQETLHALGHRVNPTNLPEMDFSEPVTKALVEHGLQLADYNALADFGEGLAGGGLTAKIPIVGPKLHAYNEWLFQDYIPRLKLQMARLALERNRKVYPKLSEDKLLELTSNEANAAFGELPYKYWGRSPTLQDALRTFLLAPDFLEARTRFVGRALSPHGREQLVALGLLAATQYITARIVNQQVSGDPHWEPKNAFRVVVGNHAWGLRTIPSDMLHLFSDTRGFFYNRMSPLLRTTATAITGRDDRGVKRDLKEQVKDMVKMPVPISMKSRLGQKWWEAFLNSFGLQQQRWSAEQTIQQKAADWKKEQHITSPVEIEYDQEKDQFAPLRLALQDGNTKEAQQQFDKLKAFLPPKEVKRGKYTVTLSSEEQVKDHFKRSLHHPFAGSKANDEAFVKSLDESGKQEYQEAKDSKEVELRMVESLH